MTYPVTPVSSYGDLAATPGQKLLKSFRRYTAFAACSFVALTMNASAGTYPLDGVDEAMWPEASLLTERFGLQYACTALDGNGKD
jgi:hypothetical protein